MIHLTQSPFIKPLIVLLVFAVLIYSTACSYYKVTSSSVEDFEQSIQYSQSGQYRFFVHHIKGSVLIDNIRIANRTLIGNIVPGNFSMLYDEMLPSKRIKASNKRIINEVHIFVKPEVEVAESGIIHLVSENVSDLRLISKDHTKDFLVFLGSAIGLLAFIVIIIALTKSSCPYVYSHNGEDYTFEGEIYSGAVLKNLERDDYLKLNSIKAVDHTYKVKISNELYERQYINQAELIVVNHPRNTTVLYDENGTHQTFSSPIVPLEAITQMGQNILPHLIKKDTIRYLFDELQAPENQAIIFFRKPEGAKNGRLLLKGRNSLWGDYVIGEFGKKFGNRFSHWSTVQENMSREERLQRIEDSKLLLSVSIKNEDEWTPIDQLYMVGPLGEREMVIPIDLRNHKQDTLTIKLQTGFMFWEIDYSAIDYSDPTPVVINKLDPVTVASKSAKAKAALSAADDLYLEQKKVGDFVILNFPEVQITQGFEQSVFLHCRGYYEYIRHYRGKGEVAELQKFRKPGYFAEFSKQEYQKLNKLQN